MVEKGRVSEGYDFTVPFVLRKGQVDVVVTGDRPGKLTFCFIPLGNLFKSWSTWPVRAGFTFHMPVVEGERYELHAHLEYAGGELDSERFVFTATARKIIVTLRPDAARGLHQH